MTLVLSRKKKQSLIINRNVKITIADIRGDKVRIAIDAPSEVPVDREEIHLRKEGERRDS